MSGRRRRQISAQAYQARRAQGLPHDRAVVGRGLLRRLKKDHLRARRGLSPLEPTA